MRAGKGSRMRESVRRSLAVILLCMMTLSLAGCASKAATNASAGDVSSSVSGAGTGAQGGTASSSSGAQTLRSSGSGRSRGSSSVSTSQEEQAGTAVSAPAPETAQVPSAAETPAQPVQEPVTPQPETAPAMPPVQPQVQGNGRMLFIGDSRTIDMFADSDEPIYGRVEGDIVIYAMHARGCDYMISTVNAYGHENFDTLVTWMGANDRGYFGGYEAFYNSLLAEGKKIIVCTVGPTDDTNYVTEQELNYTNDKMVAFNVQLVNWAAANGVKVIDLYTYIVYNIQIDPDGVHYLPRPTTAIWQVILGSL